MPSTGLPLTTAAARAPAPNTSVSGTIGQPDAGLMSGGNFRMVGGFWAVDGAEPKPVPQLRIRLELTGRVTISCPAPSTGFNMETASTLAQPV